MRGVAITGIGVVSALGRGEADHRAALAGGSCGLAPLTLFTAANVPPSPVGEVPARALPARTRRSTNLPRTELLALAAAEDALAGRARDDWGDGVIAVGTTTGGIGLSEQYHLRHRGAVVPDDRALLRRHPVGCIADGLAEAFGLNGERHTFSTACSSSANAIGYAAGQVAAGARWALAGGTDALCLLTFAGFHSLRLLSPSPCQPFDLARRGLSLGEAAAFLLLEPLEAARAEGQRIWAEVSGWGCASDAHHPTAPHPEGAGAAAAMEMALADAELRPEQIDYLNAHGTATPANDRAEALAVTRVFGAHSPPISSTKGATGHTLGAAGALEAALCVLALHEGFAPGTVGLGQPDPSLPPLQHIPPGGLRRPMRAALSNSLGFGGNNAALVFTRSRGEP